MRIKPEDLTKNGYVLLEKLDYMELVPFTRSSASHPLQKTILKVVSLSSLFPDKEKLLGVGAPKSYVDA
ncbi:MAG: hypothetical protein KA479_08880 [Saprospiraceae bacterium]|jgi:hypothetical protein|nr:hypothetical protein [Saprospiraceae bacterium]